MTDIDRLITPQSRVHGLFGPVHEARPHPTAVHQTAVGVGGCVRAVQKRVETVRQRCYLREEGVEKDEDDVGECVLDLNKCV